MQSFDRRTFLAGAGAASLAPLLPLRAPAQAVTPAVSAADSGWNVLSGREDFRDPQRMAVENLKQAVASWESEREKAIAGLVTAADVASHRATARARLLEAIGKLPERTPLRPQLTATVERPGYRIEKVVFESRPHYFVTGNVYVPRESGPPYPAVLCPVGHWGTGKVFEDYQRLACYLAQRGILALVFDLPGQGERLMYYDDILGRSAVDPATSEYYVTVEHGVANGQTTLVSGNLVPYMVWDGLRALDYLGDRPDVDRGRLACTGTSGGGLQTELLSALDERIRISIPVSYGGCAADHPDRPGLSMIDVDALIAPRPLLMMCATGDARAAVQEKQRRHEVLSNVYRVLGHGDRTRFLVTEGRHGYLHDQRAAAWQWLCRWWNGTDPPAASLEEPSAPIETDRTLACTTTGQVKTALGGETILSLNRSAAAAIRTTTTPPASSQELPPWRERLRGQIRDRLRIHFTPFPPNARTLARADYDRFAVEKLVYSSEPDIYIPSLLFLPQAAAPGPAVIFVNEGGKTADQAVEYYCRPLAEAGCTVLAIDVRGVGETMPPSEPPYNEHNYRGLTEGAEASLFYSSLRVGRTLLGRRVLDVLRGIDCLAARKEVDGAKLGAIGHGMGAPLVLYAAALDDRIRRLAAARMLLSYAAILETDLYAHHFSGFAPGLLQSFDLPAVAALLAPRPLLLLNLVDQLGQRVSRARAARVYGPAGSIYDLLGAKERFQIRDANSAGEAAAAYASYFS